MNPERYGELPAAVPVPKRFGWLGQADPLGHTSVPACLLDRLPGAFRVIGQARGLLVEATLRELLDGASHRGVDAGATLAQL